MIKRLLGLSFAILTAASTSINKQCPLPDLCFSLNVPDISINNGAGDFYLQVTGPTTYSWISVAQGEQMHGAHYFVIYTSADGNNVTVSTRLGNGQSPPTVTKETAFELLEGSGVKNGTMVANIKCSNCTSWNGGTMDLTKTTNWIWGHRTDAPMNTNDITARIRKHDGYGSVTFDSSSHGGQDINPFIQPLPSTSPTTTPGSSTPKSHGPPKRIVMMYTAHAILACLAWAFVFPLGGIMIRLLSFPGLIWTHAYLQIFGWCMYVAAVGLGISLSTNPKFWRMDNKHVLIGLVIFALFFVQIFTGYIHHKMFVKKGRRTAWSWMHIWSGRACITLGIVNAGFGFEITQKGWETWEVKAYTVCAAVMWVVYVVSIFVGEKNRRSKKLASTESRNRLDVSILAVRNAGDSSSQSEIESIGEKEGKGKGRAVVRERS